MFEPLHMLWMGIWMHPYTLHLCRWGPNFGKIRVRWSPNNIVVSWLEAVNPPTSYLTFILDAYKVFESPHMLWMGIWVHPYNLTLLHRCRWGPNFGILWGRQSPNNIMVSCLEALNHSTLYLTSALDVYKMFGHRHVLWAVLWVQPYKVTSV